MRLLLRLVLYGHRDSHMVLLWSLSVGAAAEGRKESKTRGQETEDMRTRSVFGNKRSSGREPCSSAQPFF